EALDQHLLEPCREAQHRELLRDFVRDVENASAALQVLQANSTDPQTLLREDTNQNLMGVAEIIRSLGLQKLTCSQARNLFDTRKSAETTLSAAQHCMATLQALLGSPAPLDGHGAALVLN